MSRFVGFVVEVHTPPKALNARTATSRSHQERREVAQLHVVPQTVMRGSWEPRSDPRCGHPTARRFDGPGTQLLPVVFRG